MGTVLQLNLQLLYNDARLDSLLETLDEIHTAASDGNLPDVTTVGKAELVGWLYELMYTAQETIRELEQSSTDAPGLTLVK
jgi:hypothetical protein